MRFVAVTAGIVALVGASSVGATRTSRFYFYNPARSIECRFNFGSVACASFKSGKVAVLNASGAAQIVSIRRFGTRNPVCSKPPGDEVPCWFEKGGRGSTLRMGSTATDPDPRIYRCTSRAGGIACSSPHSRRGFVISEENVVRTGP